VRHFVHRFRSTLRDFIPGALPQPPRSSLGAYSPPDPLWRRSSRAYCCAGRPPRRAAHFWRAGPERTRREGHRSQVDHDLAAGWVTPCLLLKPCLQEWLETGSNLGLPDVVQGRSLGPVRSAQAILQVLAEQAPLRAEAIWERACQLHPGKFSRFDIRQGLKELARDSKVIEAPSALWSLASARPAAAPAAPRPVTLTDEQRAVVDAPASHWTLVEAGPGTGKTAVACARVARLLASGVDPSAILMISFTRSAVAELRNRIAAMGATSAGAAAVRITTLDSEAWHLGVGVEGHDVEKLFRGYAANIQDATRYLSDDKEELIQFLDRFSHVIIDEAQDMVGSRAELLLTLLSKLPEQCGVTIFADPAQAIFGFSSDFDDGRGEANVREMPFCDRLLDEFSDVRRSALSKVFRSDNPRLVPIFISGRAEVFGNATSAIRHQRLNTLLREKAGPAESRIEKQFPFLSSDDLVLYRRRAEVLMASSYLCRDGLLHRLRLPKVSLGLQPWVAVVLGEARGAAMSRPEFDRAWTRAGELPLMHAVKRDEAWSLLRRVGRTQDQALDLRQLRRVLGRSRPPAELAQTEAGTTGPILGTIHAAKGREADRVALYLPWVGKELSEKDMAEEVRIVYVGATRAKNNLAVADSFGAIGRRNLGGTGRVYGILDKDTRKIQVEIGRDEDVDGLSVISRQCATESTASKLQSLLRSFDGVPIALEASMRRDTQQYSITCTRTGVTPWCDLSLVVNNDLKTIGKTMEPDVKLPSKLTQLWLFGLRGFAVPDDHPRLASMLEPWATSGFFLVPVIRGFIVVMLWSWRRR